MTRNKMMCAFVLCLQCTASAYAANLQAAPIDQIAAVVNNDVITLYELNTRINTVERQLKARYAIADTGSAEKADAGAHDYGHAAIPICQ